MPQPKGWFRRLWSWLRESEEDVIPSTEIKEFERRFSNGYPSNSSAKLAQPNKSGDNSNHPGLRPVDGSSPST